MFVYEVMLAQREKASIYHAMQCIQDPGNLEADLQAGGFAGYALLWLFLVCTIMVSAFNCNNLIWHLLLFLSHFLPNQLQQQQQRVTTQNAMHF